MCTWIRSQDSYTHLTCEISGNLSDPGIQDFAEISTFREKSRFVRFPGFPRISRISRISRLFGISGLLAPEPRFWLRARKSWSDRFRTWRQVWQVLSRPDDPGAKSRNLVSDPKSCVPGAIYRPLSIATSVENDWGRRGPFWRSPLTLALETVQFLKKIANQEIEQNCRKRYIFLLYPSKSRKKCIFFASAE